MKFRDAEEQGYVLMAADVATIFHGPPERQWEAFVEAMEGAWGTGYETAVEEMNVAGLPPPFGYEIQ